MVLIDSDQECMYFVGSETHLLGDEHKHLMHNLDKSSVNKVWL